MELLAPGQAGDSSTTQDVLRALDSLLASKNALISIWISYETNRLQLQLDTEALQLTDQGLSSSPDYLNAQIAPDGAIGSATADNASIPPTVD